MTIKAIALKVFPEYSGRKFAVRVSDAPINCASYWEGGSRDYFRFYSLADGRVSTEVPSQSAFDRPVQGIDAVVMPEGFICVRHSIFCGKDSGITLIVRPENAAKYLPAPIELSREEQIVLIATCSFKSSYAGQSNYRFHEAHGDTGITSQDWESAKASLITRGMLNKAGAITNDGRNALTGLPNWYSFRKVAVT